jgi:hypothetical protein
VVEGRSFWRRHLGLVWAGGVLLFVIAALAIVAAIVIHRAEPFLRAQIVSALSSRFHARVELDSFHVSLVKGIQAEGKGLRIWPPSGEAGSELVPINADPLISLQEFRFHAPLHYRAGEPVQIRHVYLRGLTIKIPPRQHSAQPASAASNGAKGSENNAPASDGSAQPPAAQRNSTIGNSKWLSFVVNTVECVDASLVLETSKPGKLPLNFAITSLELTSITPDLAMNFKAELTNPRPVGLIHTAGRFGPWQSDDPGESPIRGDYHFEHADLSTFRGIAGILDSTGQYQGTLRNLVVDGVTDTPDFSLTNFGNKMPLHTKFHALVDATNGDTRLEPVDAELGHSHFTAEGPIVRVNADTGGKLHPAGHDIALKVNIDRARIEDFLTLAGKSGTPLLTGGIVSKASLHIPPGPEPAHKRLTLDGEFHLDQALFTSEKVQDKIRQLSLRGQGHPGELKKTDSDTTIESQMNGRFNMANGVITLPQLAYIVPGAEIDLAGTYALEGGAIDFKGTAKMQATVSQMVGGWKGFFLKPADRFFKKDGAGTEVQVYVSGTREKPDFGVDLGHKNGTHPEKPGDKPQAQ